MNTPRTNKARTDDNGDPSWVFDLMEKIETELAEVKAQVSDMTSALAACHEILNSLKDDEDWPVKPALKFEVEAAFNLAQIELYGK